MNPPPFDKALLKRGSGPTQAGRGALWGRRRNYLACINIPNFPFSKTDPLINVRPQACSNPHGVWGGGGGSFPFLYRRTHMVQYGLDQKWMGNG